EGPFARGQVIRRQLEIVVFPRRKLPERFLGENGTHYQSEPHHCGDHDATTHYLLVWHTPTAKTGYTPEPGASTRETPRRSATPAARPPTVRGSPSPVQTGPRRRSPSAIPST